LANSITLTAPSFIFRTGCLASSTSSAFLFLKQPHTEPLMFLQSLSNSRLCFILLPILVVDPNYAVNLDAEDLAALASRSRPPTASSEKDILCAAIVTTGSTEQGEPTANLMAPVVVNLKEQIGMQVIPADSPTPTVIPSHG
jgi:flagellar assembly factor FliW